MLDLTLAVLHHILVFGLVAMLAIERTLLKAPVIEARRLAGLDGGYGLTAVLVLAVGVARVIWGGKGWAFYEANPFFWAKLAIFTVIGLISIMPTIAFIKWARASKADANWQPDAAGWPGPAAGSGSSCCSSSRWWPAPPPWRAGHSSDPGCRARRGRHRPWVDPACGRRP